MFEKYFIRLLIKGSKSESFHLMSIDSNLSKRTTLASSNLNSDQRLKPIANLSFNRSSVSVSISFVNSLILVMSCCNS